MQKKNAVDKTQHPFILETLRKLGTEGKLLNLMKGISLKPTANIIINGERLKPFFGQRCLFSLLLFNFVLEVLARSIKEEKEIKGI